MIVARRGRVGAGRLLGGKVWESNPPGTQRPHTGFEVQEAHRNLYPPVSGRNVLVSDPSGDARLVQVFQNRLAVLPGDLKLIPKPGNGYTRVFPQKLQNDFLNLFERPPVICDLGVDSEERSPGEEAGSDFSKGLFRDVQRQPDILLER